MVCVVFHVKTWKSCRAPGEQQLNHYLINSYYWNWNFGTFGLAQLWLVCHMKGINLISLTQTMHSHFFILHWF